MLHKYKAISVQLLSKLLKNIGNSTMRHAATEVVNEIEDFINMTRLAKTDAQYTRDRDLVKERLINCFIRAWTVIMEKVLQEYEAKTKPPA